MRGFPGARILPLVVVVAGAACAYVTYRPSVDTPQSVSPPAPGVHSPFLKAHTHSGEVYLFDRWSVVDSVRSLTGHATRYSITRTVLGSGNYELPVDSIALIETNIREQHTNSGLGVLASLSVVWGVTSGICLADPKSCFGSCPTFYVSDGRRETLQAEGFSASVARVLEASDVDALPGARWTGRRVSLVMKNEALETHAVQSVRLRAVRRSAGLPVFAGADGRFWAAPEVVPAASCRAPEGDCRATVEALDSLERRAPADSADLGARETIELTFAAPRAGGPAGLVIGARHSFVSTFLFYQTLAFMGRSAGDWLARLERDGPERLPQALGLSRAVGGIEVEAPGDDGAWHAVGVYDEAGPIASDVQIVPLPAIKEGEPVRVRLRLARGAWRLGYVALATNLEPADDIVVEPVLVERDGRADTAALAALHDPARRLATFPGDAYRLHFDLPGNAEGYEFFLETRGYYYEWMRQEWLAEENPGMVALIMSDPNAALRALAPAFKRVEPEIERLFWQSRFGR